MKENKKNSLKSVLKKLYKLLDKKQKMTFIVIIIIMIISAILTQITPKAIGWLTDDILVQNEVSFKKVIPFLIIILIVNVVNEIIKIVRRVMVEDTATRTEKRARRNGNKITFNGTIIIFQRKYDWKYSWKNE